MPAYRRFLLTFLAFWAGLTLLVGGITYVVDPYGINWRFVRKGFNLNKAMYQKGVRLTKAYYLPVFRPHALLAGTSRAEYGLCPENPLLDPWRPVYNVAITAGNMYEVRRYIEHAVQNADVRLIVLGLDLVSFGTMSNSPDFDERRLGRTPFFMKIRECYLSWNAVKGVIRTIKRNRRYPDEITITREGWRTPYKTDRDIAEGRTTLRLEFEKSELDYFRFSYYRFRLSPERFEDLQAVIDLCRRRGIRLLAFISPAHARQWEVLHRSGAWPQWEEWKRRLVRMLPVWDFSGFNSVTVHDRYYLESSHYRKEAGDLVLARLLGADAAVPADFGVLLTPGNIEAHLARIRRDRERWAAAHPEDVADIARLQREVEAERTRSGPGGGVEEEDDG
ncbi:hypothetical protein G3N55_05425 [Dissulfurirhabdus thermomarina]|uniref:Uncharacterized protein n=1 Tax=Dissulfurirhabdus thermomarina TaxID=1765737 RepID=A0A6N9TLX9_DISTH|nr:hypothetical protein [Dissulfurirhabdus thermomarina]NDY42282.1 hypothetical protein [Dissulfurirhabdus thermomarina]NMX23034.1 hypothetical protein [Dissulfurirhabdus thermomarina]